MDRKRISATVTGRVQGVWFLDFTRKTARSLNVSGFVRNEPDGTVYLEAEGPETEIKSLIAAVKRGSPLSRVDRVVIRDLPVGNDSSPFEIRFGA
ncbi:MAG: acylphosphatase [FCB group bacterium]|nr:acylphosphatase [FCB group bacterium]